MAEPTPTTNARLTPRPGDFATLGEALDYAAEGETGFNFYDVRGQLTRALPYSELRERAREFAHRMIARGLEPGARVAMIAETGPAFPIAFFGCQYAGLIPAPLPAPVNLGGKKPYVYQLGRMVAAVEPALAIASGDLASHLAEAVDGRAGVVTPEEIESWPRSDELRPAGPDDRCYIQYSSGSTAAPKGVVITQACATANAHAIIAHGLKARPGDRCASWLPLYHDMGLVGFCIAPMLAQISVDYLSTLDFARRSLVWLRIMSENRCTIAFSPSFGFDLCARRAARGAAEGLDLSAWRIAGVGGDMVRPEALEAFAQTFAANGFRRAAFLPSYGMAEATLAVAFPDIEVEYEIDEIDLAAYEAKGRAVAAGAETERRRGFVVCGRALPGHELEVRGPDGARLGERAAGRIVIRGPSVMAGYFRNDAATRAAMDDDGWLDTGDIGYLIGDEIVVTGRSKDLIISNGRNIWPQDIEWAVEALEGVRAGDAAAFSVDDGDAERVVVALQCRLMEDGARAELAEAVAATVRHAAGVDAEIALVPNKSLPVTGSGKLSRAATRAKYLAGEFAGAP